MTSVPTSRKKAFLWIAVPLASLVLAYALSFGPVLFLVSKLPYGAQTTVTPTFMALFTPHFLLMYHSRAYFTYIAMFDPEAEQGEDGHAAFRADWELLNELNE